MNFFQKNIISILFIFFAVILLFFSSYCLSKPPLKYPKRVTTTLSGQIDMCLACHDDKPDKAHGRRVVACSSCHLGNPMAGTVFEAHKGMVLNPGELKWAHKTCSQEGCHVKQLKWVKNTLMATNRGIISTLRYYWGESRDNNDTLTVAQLKETGINSPAIDYFRKLCGTCHLYLERHSLPGFLGEKGGGCTACHYVKGINPDKTGISHPGITKKVPLENCVRCHNRSGRIGLTYQGLYESEGYGTPFEDGEQSSNQLPDGRFVQRLYPDVHFEKGLVCIDCHNKKELMGDGTQRSHLYQQVEIRCKTCHTSQAELRSLLNESKNKDITFPKLTNLKMVNGNIKLLGKLDNKLHVLNQPSDFCKDKLHFRLSCQACHSTWVPQCYGCHVRYDKSKKQLDKLSLKETFGQWEEFKSFMRYENPVLGVEKDRVNNDYKIVILVPG